MFRQVAKADGIPAAGSATTARQGILPGPRPFFNDRYAAINGRNDSHLFVKGRLQIHPKIFDLITVSSEKRPKKISSEDLFFWSSPSIQPKKGLNFWRRPFSLGPLQWWRPAGTLLELNVAHKFKRLPTPALQGPNSRASEAWTKGQRLKEPKIALPWTRRH